MGAHEEANGLLKELGAVAATLADLEARATAEMEAVKKKHEKALGVVRTMHESLEGHLIKLMKANKVEFFDGTDQVDLEHGLLLRGEEEKIRIPRNAAAAIEAQGWEEGLKRTVAVVREVVEKWPDERLVVIGAERRPVETYSYELKGPGDCAACGAPEQSP